VPRKGEPPPPKPPAAVTKPPPAKANPELQAQTRKLLGKHYASKYKTRGRTRGGS
jgi:hypothetical protein